MQKIFLMACAVFLLSGCTKTDTANSNDVVYDERDHKLQSAELKEMMFTLDMTVYDQYKNKLEKEDTKVRYALRLADDVLKIADKLEEKAVKDFNTKLTTEDKEIYSSTLERLRTNAKDIEKSARNYEMNRIDANIVDMKNTCKICHTRFGVNHDR